MLRGLATLAHCGCYRVCQEGLHQKFDSIVSILVFLHITDKATLFRQCLGVLKVRMDGFVLPSGGFTCMVPWPQPGGSMYVEDFVRLRPLSSEDKRLLEVRAIPLSQRVDARARVCVCVCIAATCMCWC